MCPAVSVRAALLGEGRLWGAWDREHGSVTDLCLVSCKYCANVAFGMPNNRRQVPLKSSVGYLKVWWSQKGHGHGLSVLKASLGSVKKLRLPHGQGVKKWLRSCL